MSNMNKILPIVLVALILVSAVQALQLNALKEKLVGGKLSATTAPSVPKATTGSGGVIASSGSSKASAPSGINELPSMVGGC